MSRAAGSSVFTKKRARKDIDFPPLLSNEELQEYILHNNLPKDYDIRLEEYIKTSNYTSNTVKEVKKWKSENSQKKK